MRILALAFAVGLLTAGAAQAQTPSPLSFAESQETCIAAVRLAAPAGQAKSKAVDAVSSYTGDAASPACTGPAFTVVEADKVDPSKAAYSLPQVVVAIKDGLEKTRRDYGCDKGFSPAGCEGVTAGEARLAALRARLSPDRATRAAAASGALQEYNDFLRWDAAYLSFGQSTRGLSLLQLTLEAAKATTAAGQVDATTDAVTFPGAFRQTSEGVALCDADCSTETAKVVALYPLLKSLDTAWQGLAAAGVEQYAQRLSGTRDRWEAYHFGGGEARVQLPWELAANGLLWKRPKAANGAYEPFPNPPRGAVTLLHPSVGLSLKDSRGADSNLVGVVEVLGFSRWTYGEDNKRSGEWGLSAIAAYQPRDNGRDWGYGVLARLPWRGVNVAWTRTRLDGRKDFDQFLFSIDVSKYISGAGDLAKAFKLKDPAK